MTKTRKAPGKPLNRPARALLPFSLPRLAHGDDGLPSLPHVRELLEMLRYKRPHKSESEARFIARYLDSIPGMQADGFGNRFLEIGNAPVVWSSHTDSVHNSGGMQRITYGAGVVTLHRDETSNCLGADCATGVWIMRQMILRGVPGLYVFHRQEETGGYGSQYFVRNSARLLENRHFCIAFDRKGFDSVVTWQFGEVTASDGFAESLAFELGGAYAPDDTGVFTDSANYAETVAECSNLSVGYSGAHTAHEMQDIPFAAWLLDRICAVDVSRLSALRVPTPARKYLPTKSARQRQESLSDLCFDYPEIAAEILESLGISADDFRNAMLDLALAKGL